MWRLGLVVLACITFLRSQAHELRSPQSQRRGAHSAQPLVLVEDPIITDPLFYPTSPAAQATTTRPLLATGTTTDEEVASESKRSRFHWKVVASWMLLGGVTFAAHKTMHSHKEWTPKHRAPYTAGLIVLWTVLVFSTAFYMLSAHDWTWLQCLYFCVVTVTTVGYGDFVPYDSVLDSIILLVFLWFNMFVLAIVLGMVVSREIEEFDQIGAIAEDASKAADEQADQRRGIVHHIMCIVALVLVGAFVFKFLENWTFLEGIFFATATLTTVGYGHFLPDSGSMAMSLAILYILIGVPITGAFVGSLGSTIDDCFKKRKEQMSRGALFGIYVTLIVGWWLFGATLFHVFLSHGWTWPECFYFAAVTMTTVGYGDYVPAGTNMDYLLCIIYIWISVVVVATVFGDLNGMVIDAVTRGMHRHKAVLVQVGLLGLIIFTGMVTFEFIEGWGALQGLLFTSVTCTTVGYGHFLPSSLTGKLVVVPFILISVPLVGALVGHVSSQYSEEIQTVIADLD